MAWIIIDGPQIGRQIQVARHCFIAIVDPAIERRPLIFGFGQRLAAIGQITLFMVFRRLRPNRVQKGFSLVSQRGDDCEILVVLFFELRFNLAFFSLQILNKGGVGEEGLERKIVFLTDFIKFVIMASGAAERST